MQKWCPDPFTVPEPAAAAAGLDFETTQLENAATTKGRIFRRESGFSDPTALMATLTPDERAQLFDQVEQDLQADFESRESKLREQLESQLTEAKAAHDTSLKRWSEEFAARLEDRARLELQEAAQAAARLAVELARKIVRGHVKADPLILVRAVETVLFKIQESGALTVATHPDEAAWLNSQPEVLERLNIGVVEPDRRVEQGGALVRCQGREWDATVSGQLATLDEVIIEMIQTAGAESEVSIESPTGEPHEPTLD